MNFVILNFFLVIVFAQFAKANPAEYIELPPEELAQESVHPMFDRNDSVRSRSVVTAGKFDVGGFYGMALTEPIFNVSKLGFNLYYHSSENHAWGLILAKNSTGLSTYADQLNSSFSLDLNRAPNPDLVLLGDYNLKAFYGKMSLSKSTVLNLSLFGSLAAGVVKYSNKTYPAVAFGLGQKFYFNKNWALRFDLRLMANTAPIPFLKGYIKKTDPVPSANQFDERMTYTTNLDLGVSYLF